MVGVVLFVFLSEFKCVSRGTYDIKYIQDCPAAQHAIICPASGYAGIFKMMLMFALVL